MKIISLRILTLLGCFLLLGCSQGLAGEGEAWTTDLDAALTEAKTSGKHVLVDFSGSDWCGWCIKLDKEVFAKQDFLDYAKDNLILVMIDFPQRTEQSPELKQKNQELSRKYGIQGFPTVLLFSPKGDVIARTGYQSGGPEKYIEHIQQLIKDGK